MPGPHVYIIILYIILRLDTKQHKYVRNVFVSAEKLIFTSVQHYNIPITRNRGLIVFEIFCIVHAHREPVRATRY